MSLLVTDADECATLEATLAFLDAWEAPSTDSGSTGSPSSTPTLAAVTPARCLTPQQKQQQIDHHSVKTKPKKPRRKYPNSSSTVLQRRKKAEILALRAQVEQLELQLQQLKKVPGAALVVAEDALAAVSSGSTTWAEQAAAQYRGRLRAEKTNAKLKSVMANQVKASEALRSLLQKTAALDGMAFVLQNPCRPLDGASFEMELLEQRVERLYLHADAVYKPDELEWLGLRANVRQHDALGKVLEIVSTTPMMCSVQAASEALWEWLSLTEPLRDRPNTLERSYTMQLESRIGTLVIKKQNFVRRYHEADRVVFVWADVLQLPEYGLQFRNQVWMFVTPSPDAPGDASVFRTFQQLFVDGEENHPLPNASFAQEFAFEELAKMYRRFLQSQQNVAVERTGSAATMPEFTV